MLKKLTFLLMIVGAISTSNAQIKTPQPSPSAKMEQVVGLTNVTLEYSRPAMRGRTIFGDLVPYDQVWRTGANANTKITFDTNVTIAGQELKKGTYAVYTIPNPVVTDNCTSVVTLTNNAPTGGIFPIGNTVVTWTATDAAGNTVTKTQLVTVTDTTAPVISTPVAMTATAGTNCNATVVLTAPTATDNCTSPVTLTNNAPASGLFPVGVTTVTWTATDASGNSSTRTQTVTVTDAIAPVITAPATITNAAAPFRTAFILILDIESIIPPFLAGLAASVIEEVAPPAFDASISLAFLPPNPAPICLSLNPPFLALESASCPNNPINFWRYHQQYLSYYHQYL